MLTFGGRAGLTVLAILAASVAAGAPTSQPDKKPTTQPAAVPKATIEQIRALFKPPAPQTPATEQAALLKQQLAKVLDLSVQAEKKYPDAEDLHVVRLLSLQAAAYLAYVEKTPESRNRVFDIAARIVASNAPMQAKLRGDLLALGIKIAALEGQSLRADAGSLISQLVRKYAKTPLAARALVNTADMAGRMRLTELRDGFVKELETRYINDVAARTYLRRIGRAPDAGRPFQAVLTRLDGTTLKLPADLTGKVVLIDFWATWCAPCRAAMPAMRRLYGKYKARGLEIVGISLDEKKSDVEEYVRKERLNWIHTFTGKGSKDPTAIRHFVAAIPSVWLVGRGGRVISVYTGQAAYDRLEWAILKAIRMPRPRMEGE